MDRGLHGIDWIDRIDWIDWIEAMLSARLAVGSRWPPSAHARKAAFAGRSAHAVNAQLTIPMSVRAIMDDAQPIGGVLRYFSSAPMDELSSMP
ncbi:MAG: hypothetical protein NVS3B20_03270 [Polyangiales bacterium]